MNRRRKWDLWTSLALCLLALLHAGFVRLPACTHVAHLFVQLFDLIIVAPCTGNTIAKLANAITDTPVTMAVKAHLRNNKPVVLGIATNDALGGSAKNIGLLHNTKNIYFVPYGQDDPVGKNNSLICDFTKIPQTIEAVLDGRQIQPVII